MNERDNPALCRRPDEQTLLLWFLHERDVTCPRCGYNVRNLTQPVCPECREELALSVRTRGLRVMWFLAAVAPAFYSGLAAPIVLADLIYETRTMHLNVAWPWWAADAIGWLCAAFAVGLVLRRECFLQQSMAQQRRFAAWVWAAHAALFVAFIAITLR